MLRSIGNVGLLAGVVALAAALWPPPATAGGTAFGVRVGAGCMGRAAMPQFERFTGRKIEHVVDAFNQDSWPQFESSIDWLSGCWKGVDAGLTVSVPMLTYKTPGSLAEGAAGKYDATFLKIANALVRDGHGDAIVRIGWEFNGKFQPWFAGKDPASYVAYWRRIVGIMRGVPGQHFRFEWTNASGIQDMPSEQAYPGDDVVDIIGSDVYNEYWSVVLANPQARWIWIQYRPYGLRWLQQFAEAHHKPVAFPEWGTGLRPDGHGGGDDPVFVNGMAEWFKRTNALYQCYWDVKDSSGIYDDRLSSGLMPAASAAYKSSIAGARGQGPAGTGAPRTNLRSRQ